MKRLNGILGLLLLGGIFLIGFVVHAKLNVVTSQAVVEQPATVELSAEETALIPAGLQALPLYAPEALPMAGTFYSLQHTNWPPLPGNIRQLPAWSLSDGLFLVNDVMVDYVALEQEYQAEQAEKAELREFVMELGFEPEEFGLERESPMMSIMLVNPAVDLWLELTNVVNGVASVNLHNATNTVYEIWSRTNLDQATWDVETAVWPTNGSCMPFTVPIGTRTNQLFLWARDWTGIDENTNGVPDWWEWKHFGNFTQSMTNDYDGDGVNNGTEYTNNTDPNTIVFELSVTNLFVSSMSVPVTLQVSNGVPASVAVLVDSTNFAGATWQPYTATPTVALGMAQGWHEVWIGLRGRPADAQQTWQWTRLKLDYTAPTLVVTKPAPGSATSKPMLQLSGYSPEPLACLTFDVTNALGALTNQTGLTVDQHYDRSALDLTTNSFECLDIALAAGTNVVTLHATDRAGNLTVTNLVYVFGTNGDTTAPAITVTWPQTAAQISGDKFTLQGKLDDETATLTAQIVSTNGTTNRVSGLIERDGTFWVENLPLSTGTNTVTVTATDAAGNTSQTNLTIINSSATFTITPLDGTQLNKLKASIAGTAPTGYTVWVNGIQATNNAGAWTADNVSLGAGGTAKFIATAYPASGNPVQTALYQDKPPQVYVQHYNLADYHSKVDDYFWLRFVPVVETLKMQWSWAGGGNQQYDYATGIGFITNTLPGNWNILWPVDAWTPELEGTKSGNGWAYNGTNTIYAPTIPMEQCDIKGTGYFYNVADGKIETAQYRRTASSIVKLFTGGKSVPGQVALHELAVPLFKRRFDWWFGGGSSTNLANIAPGATAGVFGIVGSDNKAYQVLADGRDVVVTPVKQGVKLQGGDLPTSSKVHLDLRAVTFNGTDILQDTNEVAYAKPHWTNDTAGKIWSHPVLYSTGEYIGATVGFKATGGGTFPVIIKGEASSGATSFILWATNTPSGEDFSVVAQANNSLATSKVDFFNPLTVKWSFAAYTTNPPLHFFAAGTSTNQVYISLQPPIGSGLHYHTVIHLACSVPGATSEGQAATNTWSLFTGRQVKTWDGVPLAYNLTNALWSNGAQFPSEVSGLFAYRTGDCSAWTRLLIDALRINGTVGVQEIEVKSVYTNESIQGLPAQGEILVKEWSFSTNTGLVATNYAPFTHNFFASGAVIDGAGVSGQNNTNPVGKYFNHFIVRYVSVANSTNYFDPSYGKGLFSGAEAWENASLAGYTRFVQLTNGVLGLAKTNSTGEEVTFTPTNY